ncbi:Hypothetical_protein [Hexamita inflata]|uniref:Hypothetical_protein n=1 Tax=Hexamita inflata TaxID=28002 RepID=A0AA86U7P1_9EUKA|nr:Hypothetical protein HINF_LOCUS32054 [Hexamita inflata]
MDDNYQVAIESTKVEINNLLKQLNEFKIVQLPLDHFEQMIFDENQYKSQYETEQQRFEQARLLLFEIQDTIDQIDPNFIQKLNEIVQEIESVLQSNNDMQASKKLIKSQVDNSISLMCEIDNELGDVEQ